MIRARPVPRVDAESDSDVARRFSPRRPRLEDGCFFFAETAALAARSKRRESARHQDRLTEHPERLSNKRRGIGAAEKQRSAFRRPKQAFQVIVLQKLTDGK